MALTEDEELEFLELKRKRAIASGQFTPTETKETESGDGSSYFINKLNNLRKNVGTRLMGSAITKPTVGIGTVGKFLAGSTMAYPKETSAAVLETLPTLGATSGAVAGAGPLSIPLAGVGAAGGEAYRQLGRRVLGLNAPNTPGQAAKDIGIAGAVGSLSEGAGQIAKPIISAIAKPVGRGALRVGEALTGVPAQDIKKLFLNPKWFLPKIFGGPGTTQEAGKALGSAKSSAGIKASLRANPRYNKILNEAYEKVMEGLPEDATDKTAEEWLRQNVQKLNPQEAYDTYRASSQLLKTAAKGKDKVAERAAAIWRDATKKHIEKLANGYKDAAKIFEAAATKEKFMNVLPLNKYGTPSIGRLGFGGAAGTAIQYATGMPATALMALQSPFVAGGLSAGAGGLAKFGSRLASSPAARTGTMYGLIDMYRKRNANNR